MAFDLDFAHLPGGLELPVLPASKSGLSAVSVSLMDKITTNPGGLFSNPMVNSVNFVGDSATRLETTLTNIADGSLTNPSISAAEAQNYLSLDPIQDIRTSMGNFMMHTDRLSGLLKSQGIQAPGLQQILSIGTQMQSMMTILNAGKDCLPVIGGATGLFSQDAFNGFNNTLLDLMTAIERGTATIANITDTLAGVANLIRGIADKDSQFLQNCVNQLQSAGVALVLEALNSNPCAHFIFETVANKNPGGVLDVLSKPIVG